MNVITARFAAVGTDNSRMQRYVRTNRIYVLNTDRYLLLCSDVIYGLRNGIRTAHNLVVDRYAPSEPCVPLMIARLLDCKFYKQYVASSTLRSVVTCPHERHGGRNLLLCFIAVVYALNFSTQTTRSGEIHFYGVCVSPSSMNSLLVNRYARSEQCVPFMISPLVECKVYSSLRSGVTCPHKRYCGRN